VTVRIGFIPLIWDLHFFRKKNFLWLWLTKNWHNLSHPQTSIFAFFAFSQFFFFFWSRFHFFQRPLHSNYSNRDLHFFTTSCKIFFLFFLWFSHCYDVTIPNYASSKTMETKLHFFQIFFFQPIEFKFGDSISRRACTVTFRTWNKKNFPQIPFRTWDIACQNSKIDLRILPIVTSLWIVCDISYTIVTS